MPQEGKSIKGNIESKLGVGSSYTYMWDSTAINSLKKSLWPFVAWKEIKIHEEVILIRQDEREPLKEEEPFWFKRGQMKKMRSFWILKKNVKPRFTLRLYSPLLYYPLAWFGNYGKHHQISSIFSVNEQI